jgi:hypothetical protein
MGMTLLLPLLAGCGSKDEEKNSGDYYTGKMVSKKAMSQGNSTGKQN